MSRRAWGLFAALSIIWGLPYLLIKVAVVDFSPSQIVFVRTLLGAAVIVPLVIHQRSLRKLKGVWVWVLVFAALEITGPFWLIGAAEQQLPSSLAAIMIATVPMIGAFSAWALRIDDRVTFTRFVGLIVGFVGVGVLVGFDVRGGSWWAILQLLFAAVGYALAPIIIATKLSKVPSEAVIGVALALNALVFAPAALARFKPAQAVNISWVLWASLIVLGFLCTAIAFILLFRLIAEVGPSRTVVITYLNPVVAVLLGVVLLSEPLTLGILIGFPLVLLGSILATSRSKAIGLQT
jgi:drug/metabolite transporter (DMT)-like permease